MLAGIGVAIMMLVLGLKPSCKKCAYFVDEDVRMGSGYKEYIVLRKNYCELYRCELKDHRACKFYRMKVYM